MKDIPTPLELHKQLVQELHNKDRLVRLLRAEIRSLHRKLRDSNRGAERNAHANYELAKELRDLKVKIGHAMKQEYTLQDHTAKILQQQQDNV